MCQQKHVAKIDDCYKVINGIRSKCPVLRYLFIPDEIWEEYYRVIQLLMGNAPHNSIIIMGLLNGRLDKVTSPCHRYLFCNNQLLPDVADQYRKDLQERWIFKKSEIERHKAARRFMGKVIELQIVEWLENIDWQVTKLEALGGEFDIEAIDPQNNETAIEVKYIGQMDENFEQAIKTLAGLPAMRGEPIGLRCNYLVLRVYEAAYKLKQNTQQRIAIIVIDGQSWDFFKTPLYNGRLTGKNLNFM